MVCTCTLIGTQAIITANIGQKRQLGITFKSWNFTYVLDIISILHH